MINVKNARARRVFGILIPFAVIPSVTILGAVFFGGSKYAYVTLIISALAVFLFICGFEKKKTGTRRLVATCVLAGLAIIGRFIPIFKPIAAITAFAGMYFGSEAGFLCGSLVAVVSNFYYGHGPWTPFQMLSWGLIGVFAGIFSEALKKNRGVICVFGVLSGVFFSLLMDVWTVLWTGVFNISDYGAALLAAVPHTVMYIVSNVVYLMILRRPLGEKLERLKIKYGV